jgi:hypothetical protein
VLDLELIKSIEKASYPAFMQQMQDCETIEDLAEYCECRKSRVFVLSGNDWYFIASIQKKRVEIVDIAGHVGLHIFDIISTCRKQWQGKVVTMDCRESTSYKIMVNISRRLSLDILSDKVWYWGEEVMHEIIIAM